MSTYNYRSLPPGCIRLLRLRPHEDDDAPIQCQLFEYSLASARRKGTHLYEALSYCWGSPTKSQTAFVGEGLLYITENLHAALLRLRDPALERIIWIDAICINQDDLDEKGQQVQLMAEIYARASCVIVWLENVTGDDLIDSELQAGGRQAIRALEVAATKSMGLQASERKPRPFWYGLQPLSRAPKEDSPFNEQDRLAVEKLLERPWFHRVWVLQEVAAARHVLIMCRFAEMDGQAFCSGLNQMRESLPTYKDVRSRIQSTVSLIDAATNRPKGVNYASDQFSLQISPLGHLVELHYARKATDNRDKFYALLGMSTDKPTGLVPNYQMSWKDLFPHLVKSLLPESSSIITIDEHETALIKIQGCVIGKVDSTRDDHPWDGQQSVTVHRHKPDPPNKVGDLDWTFQATSKRVHQGDIVCLLKGASLPTIVRAHQDYCTIVAIAVDDDMAPITRNVHNNTQFESLMAWSLEAENYPSNLNELLTVRGTSSMTRTTLQIPDDLDITVMLLETGQYYLAIMKVHSTIIMSEDVDESQRSHLDAIAGILQKALERRCHHGVSDTLRNLIGRKRGYVEVTEDILIQFASTTFWEPMAFVLDTQGESITVTEKCLKEAMKHAGRGPNPEMDIVKLLLNHKSAQKSITDNVLQAAAENTDIGNMETELLLKCAGDQTIITENVLVAAAANESKGHYIMDSLLQWRESHVMITAKVLETAAKNEQLRYSILRSIFYTDRQSGVLDETRVTNEALKTAYENLPEWASSGILYECMEIRGIQ